METYQKNQVRPQNSDGWRHSRGEATSSWTKFRGEDFGSLKVDYEEGQRHAEPAKIFTVISMIIPRISVIWLCDSVLTLQLLWKWWQQATMTEMTRRPKPQWMQSSPLRRIPLASTVVRSLQRDTHPTIRLVLRLLREERNWGIGYPTCCWR